MAFALTNKRTMKLKILALAGAAAVALGSVAAAQEAKKIEFDIAAQDLGAALNQFGVQSGKEIYYRDADIAGKRSDGLDGAYSIDEAITLLLDEAGVPYRDNGAGLILVGGAPIRQASAAREGRSFRVAPLDREDTGAVETVSDTSEEENETTTRHKEEIVVTGTRIKGMRDQFSPVSQVGREEMDLAGYASISDLFDDLPQNFGGGITPDTVPAGTRFGVGGASINLRGLGNEATLILLNGRRLPPGGRNVNFVDVSSIPISAIERRSSRTVPRQSTVRTPSKHGLLTYEYSSEDELDANDKSFSEGAPDPTSLLPSSQKHRVFGSGGAQLSDRIRISADGYYNHRESKGATSSQAPSLLQFTQVVETEQFGGAAGVNIRLLDDWEGDVSGSYASSQQIATTTELHGPELSGSLDDAVATIASADASVSGSLFRLTDEAVKVVFGGHYRSEKLDASSVDRSDGSVGIDVKKSRNLIAAYGEIYAPIVSEPNAVPGVNRLAATAALRYEDHGEVGHSLDPKFGLVWSPFEGLNFRGTYGTSFRAPRLQQLVDQISSAVLIPHIDLEGNEDLALYITGSTDELAPEQAETWTAGFDLSPPGLDALQFRATYFSVVYQDRIDLPGITSVLFGTDGGLRYVGFRGIIERNPGAARSMTSSRALSALLTPRIFSITIHHSISPM